jgi:hypothetical protein
MSEENVEVVRNAIAYEYYGVGDRAEAEAIFDPQVVMNPIDEEPSSVVAHHEGRGRKSGVMVDTRFYEVYTLREGKVSRVDEFNEMAEALEAAGLSE